MKTLLICSLLVSCIATAWSLPDVWTEKQIYAIPVLEGQTEHDTIVTLTALFAPETRPTISTGKSVQTISWDQDSMEAGLPPLELPPLVKKIVSDFQNGVKQKNNPGTMGLWRPSSDYQCSDDIHPVESLRYLFRQSFGKAYIVPDFKEPVSSLRVSSPQNTSIHIAYCALEARNGRLPVFYSQVQKLLPDGKKLLSPDTLGLVSVKTGTLQRLGSWKAKSGNTNTINGPIAWIDDKHLACISLIRHLTRWAVFDIETGKILAQGEWDDQNDGSNFVRNFIIRDGALYGFQANGTVARLYPVLH